MTRQDALDWARELVLGELPPFPAGLPRPYCRCGAPWFECGCLAVLDLALGDGFVVVNRPRPRA
jgi:hypothetical protein